MTHSNKLGLDEQTRIFRLRTGHCGLRAHHGMGFRGCHLHHSASLSHLIDTVSRNITLFLFQRLSLALFIIIITLDRYYVQIYPVVLVSEACALINENFTEGEISIYMNGLVIHSLQGAFDFHSS